MVVDVGAFRWRCCSTVWKVSFSKDTSCFSLSLFAFRTSFDDGIGLNIRLSSRPCARSLQPFNEHSPADHRFTRVQPHAGRHTDQHRAHILEHKDLENGPRFITIRTLIRAGYRKDFAHVTIPLDHPVVKEIIFVEQTAQESNGWQNEKTTKESNAQH